MRSGLGGFGFVSARAGAGGGSGSRSRAEVGSAVAAGSRAGACGARSEGAGEREGATALAASARRAGEADEAGDALVGEAGEAGETLVVETGEALVEDADERVVAVGIELALETASSREGGARRRGDATAALFVARTVGAAEDDTARDAGASGRSASQPRNASAITIPAGTRQSKPPEASGVVDVSSFDGPGGGSAARAVVRLGSRAP